MEKTPFLGAQNEIQKIYSNLGVMVPVGDLSQGKAPAIQPLPTEVTNDTITFNFNVMSNADVTEISYETDHMDQGTITPKKGKISISFDRKPNETLYEIYITVTNENGSTSVGQLAEFPVIPNWATVDEVLEGNKFIGEDGQEAVGTYVPEEVPEGLNYLGIPVFEYSVSEDPDTGENVIDYARLVEGSHANASEWTAAGLASIDSYQIWYRWTTNDGNGNIDGTLLEWTSFDSIDHPSDTYVDLSSVLNADALANGTYFLEAYEIIRYNGVEYATECITYPEEVYEGGPVIQSGQLEITENGETDVTGYDSVNVAVAPTDGGAVITSAIYNDNGSDTYIEFTFESLPTGMDLDNHRYLNVVMSRGYNYISEELGFEEVIAPINQIGTINYTDTFNNQYNSSTDTLHLGFCDPSFHNEVTGEDDTEVDANFYIYEDTLEYNSLKWVIPCTIVNGIV